MKQVKCLSGLKGWQCHLQDNYNSFEDFESYSEIWGIAKKLGFENAEEAWKANPILQGSVNPMDLRVVLDKNNKVEFIRPEVEMVFKKFLIGTITKEQLLKRLNAIDNRLKRLLGTKGNKSIWFRLFKGNPLATTIYNIQSYLDSPYHSNYYHFMECVEMGVIDVGMEVYFS